MTELDMVEETQSQTIEAEGNHLALIMWLFIVGNAILGHDLESLLYHFLDEFLFLFSAEPFFIPKVGVIKLLLPLCSLSFSLTDYRELRLLHLIMNLSGFQLRGII